MTKPAHVELGIELDALAPQTFRPHPRSAPCLEMALPEHFDEQIEIKKDCASMDARFGRIGAYKDRLGKDRSRCQSRHSIAALSTVTLL